MFRNFNIVSYLISLVALLFAVSVHEWAHAYEAHRLGDDTAKERGRITLNPLRHFGLVGFILIILRAPVAWGKPVPVNPNRFDRDVNIRNGRLKVSLAGIVMNLITAFACSFLFSSFNLIRVALLANGLMTDSNFTGQLFSIILSLLSQLIFVNVNLAVFNILPIPPLDGFSILARFLPDDIVYKINRYQNIISLVLLLVIVLFNGLFSRFLGFIISPIVKIITWPFETLAGLIANAFIL